MSLNRRNFIKLSTITAISSNINTNLLAAPKSRIIGNRVAIVGGGISGLCAAHLLMETGYRVTVYETRKIFGGKARSYDVEQLNGEQFPGEHGFRYFPGFYRHVTDIMKRIPFKGNKLGVYDNLVTADTVQYLRAEDTPINLPIENLNNITEIKRLLEIMFEGPEFNFKEGELSFFAGRILKILNSCQARRDDEFDKTSWWDFIDAPNKSEAYQMYLGKGLCNSLVAMKAEKSSTRTVGVLFVQLLLTLLRTDEDLDRLLGGPTQEVWISPWLDHLKKGGVEFQDQMTAKALQFKNGKIRKVEFENANNQTIQVDSDFFVLSVPQDIITSLIPKSLLNIDKNIDKIKNLQDEWMVGMQLYFNKELKLNNGHMIFINSPWSLTSIHQRQYWAKNYSFSQKHANLKDILSVCISDWNVPGELYGLTAKECTREQVFDEVWHQINKCLSDSGDSLLQRSNLLGHHLDYSIHFSEGEFGTVIHNEDPLLINTVDSLKDRPSVKTKAKNLFLTGDYIRTFSDLACMESAAESSYMAVNEILKLSGKSSKSYPIYRLREPIAFAPAKTADWIKYQFENS